MILPTKKFNQQNFSGLAICLVVLCVPKSNHNIRYQINMKLVKSSTAREYHEDRKNTHQKLHVTLTFDL